MSSNYGDLKIFSGRANLSLTEKICQELSRLMEKKFALGTITVKNFSDGEIWVKYEENIRGCDVFLVQSTGAPADNLLELLIMIDAAKRASAKRITAVIPYYGYARQDRKDQPRVPITAKLIANLITQAGANRVLTIEFHAPQIQGFFDIPVDHLYTSGLLLDHIKQANITDLTIVAPDVGASKLGKSYANRLCVPLAIVNKERTGHNQCTTKDIMGNVRERNALIVDDLIDTGGTLRGNINKIVEEGADIVYLAVTHGVLSGQAWNNIDHPAVQKIWFCDTLPINIPPNMKDKVEIVSVGSLLAEAIKRTHEDESISDLFPEKFTIIS